MRSLILLFSAILASVAHAAERSGTVENPIPLTCESLGEIIRSHDAFDDGAVIAGTMTVETEDDTVVPPAILGCEGDRHIVCVMETPSSAKRGALVTIAGRMSRIGDNYIMVDPCGVSTN
jgi:hypothetical protein